MKKIEAVIPGSERDAVTAALREQGIEEIVASEVAGTGPTETRCYRGTTYAIDYHPCVKLEILAADERVEGAAEVIFNAVRRAGGSKLSIAVSAVEQVLEIDGTWHAPSPVPSPAAVAGRAPWRSSGAQTHVSHTS
jgi:nitrogen regulatory protein P-II 1